MTKFHINKHGVPAPCKATKGNCPLGGESGDKNHFDSIEDAQDYVNRTNESEHGLIPGLKTSSDIGEDLKNEIELNEDKNEIIIDMSKAMNRDPDDVLGDVQNMIIESKVRNAKDLQDLNKHFDGEFVFANKPKPISPDEAPATMTFQEFRDINQKAENFDKYANKILKDTKFRIDDEESINSVVERQYPQLTRDDRRVTMDYVKRNLDMMDDNWLPQVAKIFKHTAAIKEQSK